LSCVLFDHSPKPERAEEPATDTSRRDFLRRAGGAAGLGLVHFTILGTLATPAFAETDDDCGTCSTDENVIDICTCKSGDNTTPPRDVCNCGLEENGGASDLCECGTEPASDACSCGQDENSSPSDYCDCPTDGGPKGGSTSTAADCCSCLGDASVSDVCSAGGSDTGWGCSALNLDYHRDPNASADVCLCSLDATETVDACKCWHDSSGQYGGNDPDGTADYCDCPTDASGHVDCCACCSDHGGQAGADWCESNAGGSTCYEEGGYPALADWCKSDEPAADFCTVAENDEDENLPGDDGRTDRRSDVCNCVDTGKESADACGCGDEGAGGTNSAGTDVCNCSGEAVDDVCDEGEGESADRCCDTDQAGDSCSCECENEHVKDQCDDLDPDYCTCWQETVQDACQPGHGAPEDYCCPQQDQVGDT